jgi:membrane fusion protein, heavy metal efflux system
MKKYIYLSTLFMILASCSNKAEVSNKNLEIKEEQHSDLIHFTDAQLQQVAIETTELKEMELSKTITVNGITRLKPENEMEVSSLMDGQFKNTKLLAGSYVTQGQVLGQLENLEIIDLQEQYLVAKAKYQLAKADYDRQVELNKTQSASNKVVQQAKFEFNQQAILIQSLGSKLKILGISPQTLHDNNLQRALPIRAPFTGYIDKVMVSNGAFVISNTPLFKIINANDLLIQLKVYQDDLPFLKIDQSIKAYTNTDKMEREGKITSINTQLTPEGYGEIIATIKNQMHLTPGMYINAKIELTQKQVYAIPTDAIISYDNKQFVYVKENKNSFIPVEVKVGVEENGFTEIENTVNLLNKPIVYKNAYTVLMQSKNIAEEDK